MSPSRHELLGVELLIAEIDPGAEWEQVDGSNDRHPGQTFDFAIGSGSDRWRAVEITAAADESEIRVRAQIEDLCTQIEQRISETDPHAAGWYVLEGIISEQTQPREFNVEHLALSRLPHSPRTALDLPDDVELRLINSEKSLRVFPLFASAAFTEGPDNETRFRAAIGRKQKTLQRAADAGYETHLILMQWVLGSTEHWQRILAETPLETTLPQFLWVVDFFPDPPSLRCLIPT